MFDHFQRTYDRNDFPWAGLEKAVTVSFREVVSVFGLWERVHQEGVELSMPCPFHLSGRTGTLVIDLATERYFCTVCRGNPETIVDLVCRILPVQRVGAEMWLLQFVRGERDRVMQEYRHLIYWLNDLGKKPFAEICVQ